MDKHRGTKLRLMVVRKNGTENASRSDLKSSLVKGGWCKEEEQMYDTIYTSNPKKEKTCSKGKVCTSVTAFPVVFVLRLMSPKM